MEDASPALAADLAATLPIVVEHQIRVEEVDAATVGLLAQELEALRTTVLRSRSAAGPALVVLDLSRVRLLGAAGLHCLAGAAEQLERDGHRMIVAHPCPLVAKVLALDPTGLLA